MTSLRQRLGEGPTMLGTWVNTPSPDLVETLGDVGFDCVFLDLEHGEYGTEALPSMLRAARAAGCFGVVRTSHVSPHEIGASLDAGAAGVLAPSVSSEDDAVAIVAAARYPPIGSRGAAPMTRAAGYGTTPFLGYRDRIEAEVVVGAQIEGPAGIAALDAILDTPYLDVVFIGPFDLSQHLGVPGETSHPSVVEAMSDIVRRATACGIATATWAPTAAAARPWIDAGVRLVTVSSSTALFTGAASTLITDLRTEPPGRRPARRAV
jgi:2-keto-3-deoxy-L-rhamnonate aldolase RhmA